MRRAFTVYQLMTILEESPCLSDRGARPAALRGTKEIVELRGPGHEADLKEATILLYSPALDPHLRKMTDLAAWVLFFC